MPPTATHGCLRQSKPLKLPTPPRTPQVREEAAAVAAACGGELSATAIAGDGPLRAAAATAGQVVVTTPAKAAQALREGVLTACMLEERLQVRELVSQH